LNKKPLISILTPVYNQRNYIEQTIRSVLNQTYQDWEWIILDDGSTDGTRDIIKSFNDGRIKYAYQEHAGLTYLTRTYNKALTMCTGDLIAMLDHDDYWPDYKLEVQIKSFDNPNVILSYGVCCIVNQKGKEICYSSIPEDPSVALNDPTGSSLKELLFARYSFIPNLTVMLRRSALVTIGGFVEAQGLYHDFPTWLRLSLEGRFASIPRCLGFHRKHPSSITVNSNKERNFNIRLQFLKDFIIQNAAKLDALGLFFDLDKFEEHWDGIRKVHVPLIPYNNAMLMLSLGSFREARDELRKFLEKDPSMKSRFIYFLLNLSALTRIDLVNPSAELKRKIEAFFQRNR